MTQMLQIHKTRYQAAFEFLSRDLPVIKTQKPDVWLKLLRHAHLDDAEATRVVSMNDAAPLLFASNLGEAVFGQFDPQVPGRIEIGMKVLERFVSQPENLFAQNFLRAKVLHEICHWGCYQKQVPDNDQAGEEFEQEAFGQELLPWWTNTTAFATTSAGNIFLEPQARANLLVSLQGGRGFAPGRLDDPDHAIFGGVDVAEAMRRGFRNNNPGNIRVGKSMWRGLADPVDNKDFQRREENFCVFREPEWGLRAVALLLRKYKTKHGLDTPRKIISRWAPASDNNDVGSYADHIATALGIGPDDFVDAEDEASLIAILRAIARHENGERPPYAAMQYQTALLLI